MTISGIRTTKEKCTYYQMSRSFSYYRRNCKFRRGITVIPVQFTFVRKAGWKDTYTSPWQLRIRLISRKRNKDIANAYYFAIIERENHGNERWNAGTRAKYPINLCGRIFNADFFVRVMRSRNYFSWRRTRVSINVKEQKIPFPLRRFLIYIIYLKRDDYIRVLDRSIATRMHRIFNN